MAVFALIAPADEPKLDAAVQREFAGSSYRLAPGQFLVSAGRQTTKEIAERVGAYSGSVGRILIFRIASYTGWHNRDIWEWIAAQEGSDTPPPEAPGAGDRIG